MRCFSCGSPPAADEEPQGHRDQKQEFPVFSSKFGVALSWDPTDSNVDLDLQAIAFDNNGGLMDAVYYNNLAALNKGLTHRGNEFTGDQGGLDEVVWANLERLGDEIGLILYVLAAHTGHLRDAKNPVFQLLEETNQWVVGSFKVEQSENEVDLVGALVRAGNGWAFRVVESPRQYGQHFIDILEPVIGDFVRSEIPLAPRRIKAAFAMEKGSVVDLPKALSTGSVSAALGWSTSCGNVELDVTAVLMDESYQTVDAVFFGNRSGHGLRHCGDSPTGEGNGDDEVIVVDFAAVPAHVEQIVFVINIYTRNKTFSLVANPYCRMLSDDTGDELCKYEVGEAGDQHGLIIARLFREPSGVRWGFQAIGRPCCGITWKDSMPAVKQQAAQGVRDLQKAKT